MGVVRAVSVAAGREQARSLLEAGLELVEITFTVPGACELVRELKAWRGPDGPPWIGMGTVTNPRRVEEAFAAGADFLVSPNCDPELLLAMRETGLFLIVGALTPTEIAAAAARGADLVKVYPLPPVGGPQYLATIRQPLGDIPMLAAGGFSVDEIPAYRSAGAVAFGIGAPLLGVDRQAIALGVGRALCLARGLEA
jgi:2-dehydro-3-deoxyphosphogluconate aldolase/(4S)-4-hydroxy-2-oxoglutarate aldolase